jgi:hypothetical protein
MIIINFYKKIDTSWEKLQSKALKFIEETEQSVIEYESGMVSAMEEYSDYKKAVTLGLRTFILQVLNDWRPTEHPVLIFNEIFYKRFDIIELDGLIPNGHMPKKLNTRGNLLKYLNDNGIKLSSSDFNSICDIYDEYEEKNIFCDVTSWDMLIMEKSEFEEYEGRLLGSEISEDFGSDEDEDDDDDDLEELY